MVKYIMIALIISAVVCAASLIRLYAVYRKQCRSANTAVKWWARAGVCLGLSALICIGAGAYVGLSGRDAQYREAQDEYALLAKAARGDKVSRDQLSSKTPDSLIPVAEAEGDENPYAEGDEAFDMNDLGDVVESDARANIDFDYLRSVNPDVVAWVSIPGTSIDYPVVQGSDNEKYLRTTFAGNVNPVGAIFLDSTCADGLYSPHVIIYGHNMKDGSMFTGLTRFKKAEFLSKYNTILLYTPNGLRTLKIICLYQQGSTEWPYMTSFANNDDYAVYVNDTLRRGGVLGEYNAANINRMYTFTTCSYDAQDTRLFIHAIEE